MNKNINNEIYINQIIRIVLSLLIIFGLHTPLFIKILLIIILDFLDTLVPFFISDKSFERYEEYDKIGDILVYLTLWYDYIKFVPSPYPLKIYITLLFMFRWIGYLIYQQTKDRKIFVLFPNLFLESLFVISLLEFMGYSYSNYFYLYIISLFLVLIYKIIQELYIHTNILNF